MKQKSTKTSVVKPLKATPVEPKLNLVDGFVLLCYSFIAVLTPNLNTYDSNGPKFYTLAILNLVAYITILIGNQLKPRQDFHWYFFRTWTGVIYTMFLLVSLLSFFKAFNIYESILNFSKLFTIFSAAYIISNILRKDRRYLYIISISLAVLLIVDSFTVFYHLTINFMEGKGQNTYEIKSVYSNKNIFTAAIFVKMAFVLWLLTFGKIWMKVLGGFSLLAAFIAALFLSTRSANVGIILLVITYALFLIIRYYRVNEKRKIIMLTIYLSAAIIVGFYLFSEIYKHLYSSEGGITTNFISKLKTIVQKSDEFGYGGRTACWKRSFKLIEENPLLGVGTGNWKVEVLKYETPTTGGYTYMYKNHNDFIETTADTGIFGGMLFLGIFVMIFSNFIKAFFKAKKGEERLYIWLFLPAFGLFCYSIDAFFNFPSDRPEIVSLFAIFVGAGIAFSPSIAPLNTHFSQLTSQNSPLLTRILISLFLVLQLFSVYIFYLNFKSLKLQRIAQQEINAGMLSSKSEFFLNGFPAIPNINVEGEPITITKARYLEAEEKYQQVIDVLTKDNPSPYDTKREFYLARAFLKLGQPDSALVYANKVLSLKPLFTESISLISSAYEAKGDFFEAIKVLNDHQMNSDRLSKLYTTLSPWAKTKQFQEIYSNAMAAFYRHDYSNAEKYFSEIIDKEQNIAQTFEYRAFCYFYLTKYQLSLSDINRAIAFNSSIAVDFNLRGANQHLLGNNVAACADFQTAIKMGNKDAVNLYEKFCK